MGVRGLTSYVANKNRKYLRNHKLYDCHVIIDGNSLACQLFVKFNSRSHCAFGGDYDKYAQVVRNIFGLFAQCQIQPIVVFDGGYEPRKVTTVIRRMQERVRALKYVTPALESSGSIFPLMMRTVFKQTLLELGVSIVQCDFEADQEIAALAQKYDYPILSYDSDFYIYNVTYIPIPHMELEARPVLFQVDTPSQLCIHCKVYKVDYFLESFGGMDKTMLPLLASLLGNDYIKISVFKQFYAQLKINKGNKGDRLEKRIARVIQWLRNYTFDTAIKRILGRMKQKDRNAVLESVRKAVSVYTDCKITIESYLPKEFTSKTPNQLPKIDLPATEDVDSMEVDDASVNEQEGSQLSESESENMEDSNYSMVMNDSVMMDCDNAVESKVNKTKIPDWLLENSRNGKVESCVFDILTLGHYFSVPQIESLQLEHSHSISRELIHIITSLLLGTAGKINYWGKSRNCNYQILSLGEPVKRFNIPLLSSIPTLSIENRRGLLTEYVGIPPGIKLDNYPEEWQLYICAMVYWIKKSNYPTLTQAHIISLCLCLIALSVLDVKIGFFRKKMPFFKKYGKLYKKLSKNPDFCSENLDTDSETEVNSSATESMITSFVASTEIALLVNSITSEDCVAVFDSFYQFHQLSEQLKMDRKLFSTHDVHVFAQFQSVLSHLLILNSVLNFPFQQSNVAKLYSGTFVYNALSTLKNCKNVNMYLENMLGNSQKILKLLDLLFSSLLNVLPVNVATVKVRHRKRKRARKNSLVKEMKTRKEGSESDEKGGENMKERKTTEEEEESYYDANNMYSILSNL